MAFPGIPTVAGGRILFTLNTAGGATKTFPSLSDLTKNAGDRLIAIIVEYDGNSTDAEFSSWGGGFTERADRAGTATMAIGVAEKISDGTETGTFTVTTADTSTNDSVLILLSVPAAHASTPIEVSVMTTSAGAPPAVSTALNPSGWGTEDTLWIAVGGSGETATGGSYTGITGAPSSYTDYADSGITADVVGGIEAAVAFRQLNAESEAPGAWTGDTSNARGAAIVIAVRGVPPQYVTADSPVVHTRAYGTAKINHTVFPSSTVHTRAYGTPIFPRRGTVSWAQLVVPPIVSGTQYITPTGLVHTRDFGTATVDRGAVTITTEAVVHARAFPYPLIVSVVQPASVVHTRAIGTAEIVEGVVTIIAQSVVHTRAYGTPLIISIISPTGEVHTRAFGTAVIVEGGGTQYLLVQPTAHERAIGAHTVARGTVTITPPSVVRTREIGLAQINPRRGLVAWAQLQIPPVVLIIAPASTIHTREFGTHIVAHSRIFASPVIHTREFGLTNVVGQQDVFPVSVVRARAFGDAQIQLEPHIAAAGLVFLWGDVDFGKIEAVSVIHERAFGGARLNQTLTATSTEHTRAYGLPIVGSYILATSTTHTRAYGTPQLNQAIILGARDTGFKPGTVATNIAGGNPDWTVDVAKVWDEDGDSAQVILGSLQNSDDLNINTLKLKVEGQIMGIEVEVVIDGAPASSDLFVTLTKNGINPVGHTADISNMTPGTYVLGGPIDLWNLSWTKAEIEADGFGVTIEAHNDTTPGTVSIDRVRIKVYTASVAPVRQRIIGNPTVGAAVTTLIPSSVVHTRTVGTHTLTISAFEQFITPPSVLHTRNITGPLVLVEGGPIPTKQQAFDYDWQVATFQDQPLTRETN